MHEYELTKLSKETKSYSSEPDLNSKEVHNSCVEINNSIAYAKADEEREREYKRLRESRL